MSALPDLTENRTQAPFGRRSAEVVGREMYGPYVVLRCLDSAGPRPRPGQFYMLAAAQRWGGGEGERPYLPRAFSVLRTRGGAGELELHFLVEDVGPGTRRLCELRSGDGLLLVGPLGRGFRPPREGRRPLLVGGGVGIAPLAICQDDLLPDAEALLGFRDRARAQAASLLTGVRVATDDGSVGHHGMVTEVMCEELLGSGEPTEVYGCGPPAMLEALRLECAALDVPAQLALESGMACGFGACFGCVVPTREGYVRLCLDGPVLDAATLDSALIPGSGH